MGKRYYCDYCDKSFADNKQGREKHHRGVHHQRLVKLHYYYFKDPEQIIAEEKLKKPCFKYMKGHCDYHPVCLFSHLTPEREAELRKQIEDRRQNELEKIKTNNIDAPINQKEPTLNEWLTKRMKTKHTETEGVSSETDTAGASSSNEETLYTLPLELQGIPNLPPSLIPPSAKDLAEGSKLQWLGR